MKEVELKWLPNQRGSIAQIYNSGVQLCFVSKKMEQCHAFVYCKDFFQDAIQASLYGKTATIFGFTYNSQTMPALDLETTRIALINKQDEKFSSRIEPCLDFINQFCKKMKLLPTKAFKVKNSTAYYFEGSGMWQNAPVLISLYTLLLRVGCVHTAGEDALTTIKKIIDGKIEGYQRNDRSQLTYSIKGIERILEKGYRKFFYIDIKKNYPENVAIGTMHGCTGIQAFTLNQSATVVPYWHRSSIDKPKKKKAAEVAAAKAVS